MIHLHYRWKWVSYHFDIAKCDNHITVSETNTNKTLFFWYTQDSNENTPDIQITTPAEELTMESVELSYYLWQASDTALQY